MMRTGEEFTEEQRNYLQGLVSGFEVRKLSRGLSPFAPPALPQAPPARNGAAAAPVSPAGGVASAPPAPEDIHRAAQDRFLARGEKLAAEEEAKRAGNPLDMWDDVCRHAAEGRFPRGLDVFRFKFHGLFYVAPAQDAFMCRLRLPNGILSSHQLRGVAAIAERHGGGYADVTTRANLQLREIKAGDCVHVLTALHELGIVPRGAGADNIRNVTGSPTAGIDPQELIDTRPLARALHHHILHHRELYGLPRKFNIAFDGGGSVSVLEDTNDIGFAAVRVAEGKGAAPGVYFRVQLGGITGHGDFARDAGVLLAPGQCVPAAAAMVRVYIENGDRTDRRKARLKYLLDSWGVERFLAETEKRLPFPLTRLPLAACEPRCPVRKHGHLGVHPQKEEGTCYAGVALPAGRMEAAAMRGLAAIAERHGSGTIRLTVWQNLLISDLTAARVPVVKEELAALGLSWSASGVRGGLVACTGNTGCRFSSTDTKRHALEIARHLEARVELDQPINIHLTGCPHSCAQHTIGDVGLLGAKVAEGDDLVEGYHLFVGGGHGAERGLGRELYRDVPFAEVPRLIERMLRGYLDRREAGETFLDFTRRHSPAELREFFGAVSSPGSPVPS
jgi:ferredoxin-nitrite reductase